MIVVSDTTPLISLMKASRLDVLQKMFGDILIPEAVFEELTTNDSFQEEAEQIRSCAFIRRVSVDEQKSVAILRRATGLDQGESEAIIYADDHQADFLLMDEASGRKVAKAMGLRIMGTVGVLVNAFEDGILTAEDVEDAFEVLRNANRRISEELIQNAMEHIQSKKP